ncbi:hypothetical protein BGX28_002913 [Mortierella sp. GBA30]|nr:hypothetical protein BGX28_002913 [Mortierella sp. GBA30]
MPAETKRKFQTGQPVSTRRRAKKQKLAAVQAERDAITPSKKAQRKASKPAKPVKAPKPSEGAEDSEDDDIRENDDEEEEEDHDSQENGGDDDEQVTRTQDDDDEDQEEDDEEVQEPIGKGKKGYRKKVKKPSGKKGKVFADTNAMLSIIDQVAGKEEERSQIKQAQMGKIKSKLSAKEQKQADKEKAKKALIDKKIEEIKRKKTEKRKEAKHRAAEQEAKADASSGKRSVSFQL